MPRGLPSLRHKIDHGREVGVVTLTDSLLHKRRDFYCGLWDDPQTRQRYTEIILEWQAASHRWPCTRDTDGIAVVEVVQRYWRWAEAYYSKGETQTIRAAWTVLVDHCGDLAAAQFGPVKMREVRQRMIDKGWNREFINRQVHRVAAIFKWATSNELLPPTIYQALKTLEPLKRGRCKAPEKKPVRPVPVELVDAVKPFLSRQVWAIVQLQRLTGARPGELLILRRRDIDCGLCEGGVWRTQLEDHKTAHHGKARTIYFGPQAQEVLSAFIMRPDDAFLFSPAEAENERIELATQDRQTPEGTGNRAKGSRRADLGPHYTTASYRRAIARACEQAFPPPSPLAQTEDETISQWRQRLTPEQRKEVKAWQKLHYWHPHQLRHTAATSIRKRFGLEAAAVVLGHSSALVTDCVYAQRDEKQVIDVMKAMG